MMKGIIYKATNTLNGKVYIGQTVSSLAHRRGEHQRDAAADSANIFHTALYQYPGLFDWEVIDTFSGSREEVIHALNVAEEYHILKCNSTDERFGYNATAGGYSSDKFAEHIKRRAKALDGQSRVVLQYDADGNFVQEFESINAVCAFLGKPKMHGKVLFGGLHYGYQWREKTSSYYPRKIEPYNPIMGAKATKILAYDKEGNFAGRFTSVTDAEKATGIRAEFILESSRGKHPQDVDARRKRTDFFFFRDAENYPKKINVLRTTKQEPETENVKVNPAIAVLAYDPKSGAFVAEYASMSEAHTKSGASASTIRRSAQLPEPVRVESPKQKYIWRRKEGEIKASIEIIPYEVKTTERKKMEHRIIQYSLEGELIKVWENAHAASEAVGENYSSIYKQLAGRTPTKNSKFIWRHYSEGYPERITPSQNNNGDRENETIFQLNRTGDVVAKYADRKEAAGKTGVSISHVCNILAGRVRHPNVRLIRETDYYKKYK